MKRKLIKIRKPINVDAERGRIGKLPLVKDDILKLVREGNYTLTAVKAVGVTEAAYYIWKRKGLAIQERLMVIENTIKNNGINTLQKRELLKERGILIQDKYFKFFSELQIAEADGEVQLVKIVKDAGKKNWGAAMTLLERKYAKRWGRHDRVTRNDNKMIEVNVTFQNKLQELRKLDLPPQKIESIIEVLQLKEGSNDNVIDVDYEDVGD